MENIIEQRVLMNPREGLQTPGCVVNGNEFLNPELLAPCYLVRKEVISMMPEISNQPELMIELPTPMSCPSATHMVHAILESAEANGCRDQVPVHTRMTVEDFQQAVNCGATAIHLYGNSSIKSGDKATEIPQLLSNLENIAMIAYRSGVRLRASLEQATQTHPEKIEQFIKGIQKINHRYDRNIITAIGLPDTNGMATPEEYKAMLEKVAPLIKEAGLTLFVHLHNDAQNALANIGVIQQITQREEIPIVIETVDKRYPGERVGIEPTFSNLSVIGFTNTIPHSVYRILSGHSWVQSDPSEGILAQQLDVAGVHSSNPHKYNNGFSNRFPAPGLYGIMGQQNVAFLQQIQNLAVSEKDVLRAAALIGREFACQHGNQSQKYALALARLTAEDPEFIIQTAQRFGQPLQWLTKPVPKLEQFKDRLERVALELWGEPLMN